MCTYQTERIALSASAKGATGWFTATSASLYFDHPVHHPRGHALMVDVMDLGSGPSARVALELDPESARELAEGILRVLAAAPADLLSDDGRPPAR